MRIFYQIMIPISKPILASVGLFYALSYWNDWFMGLMFVDNEKLYPLQLILRRMVSNMEAAKNLIPPSSHCSDSTDLWCADGDNCADDRPDCPAVSHASRSISSKV